MKKRDFFQKLNLRPTPFISGLDISAGWTLEQIYCKRMQSEVLNRFRNYEQVVLVVTSLFNGDVPLFSTSNW